MDGEKFVVCTANQNQAELAGDVGIDEIIKMAASMKVVNP